MGHGKVCGFYAKDMGSLESHRGRDMIRFILQDTG